MHLIELENVQKTYQLGEISVPVLRGISLRVARGEFVALMGASGSGKTTLMNILGCLDRPTSGSYRLEGIETSDLSNDQRALIRNRKIGFVFQNFNLLPRTSAVDNIMMPLAYTPEAGIDDGRQRADELLRKLGLTEQGQNEPSQLSGGQQQRVAIARALMNRPSLLFADEPTGNLDSHTSEEVLRIFQQLNEEEGVTIILVTHDPNVAKAAKRVIRISDGVIESESWTENNNNGSESPRVDLTAQKDLLGKTALRPGRMFRTAVRGLRRNVMRAALTTLGIVIGVAAVIAMMEIGRGSSNAIQKTIASMGANNLMVFPGTASSGGVSFGAGSTKTLTPADSVAVAKECPSVKAAAPIVRARAQVVYGNRNWVPTFIYGTTPNYLEVRDWGLDQGEMFSNRDVRNISKVVVLGKRIVTELFQGESPIGKEIRMRNVAFKVIGVLASKGANMMGLDQDDVILAPWTAIKYRVSNSSLASANQSEAATSSSVNTLNQIYPTTQTDLYPKQSDAQQIDNPLPVKFANIDMILTAYYPSDESSVVSKQITSLLRERHRIRPGEAEDFNIRDMTEITKALTSTATLMTKLLLAVALISLVVGGVGIMNIMLVSVTERTREIGLRMAVGARSSNVLQQFLVESVVLCFFGGMVGILIGQGISFIVSAVLRWPVELSVDAIAAAFLVSAAVGITFGYYPAWKASRLDPIIALRYE